jgi:hypothetical protein
MGVLVDPDDLESLIDRQLRRLPEPSAPRSLLPRVMAAVAEARRPWYARAWRTWPIGLQIASSLACLAAIAAMSLALPAVQTWLVADSSPVWMDLVSRAGRIVVHTENWGHAAEVVWRALVAPVATAALVPVLMMCAASLAFGAALSRLAFMRSTT